jgi:hypothetical protein
MSHLPSIALRSGWRSTLTPRKLADGTAAGAGGGEVAGAGGGASDSEAGRWLARCRRRRRRVLGSRSGSGLAGCGSASPHSTGEPTPSGPETDGKAIPRSTSNASTLIPTRGGPDTCLLPATSCNDMPKTKICDTPRARKNDAQPTIVTMIYCPGTSACRMHPVQ